MSTIRPPAVAGMFYPDNPVVLQQTLPKLENLAEFAEMAPVRRRTVGGKRITVREYLLDAGAREFLVLYWVPPEPEDPVLLLNIRLGGQDRYRWSRKA